MFQEIRDQRWTIANRNNINCQFAQGMIGDDGPIGDEGDNGDIGSVGEPVRHTHTHTQTRPCSIFLQGLLGMEGDKGMKGRPGPAGDKGPDVSCFKTHPLCFNVCM